MRTFIFIIILSTLCAGCANQASIMKIHDGVVFKAEKDTKMTYKMFPDGTIECTYDSRNPSLVEDIIKMWAIKEVNRYER